MVPDIHDYHRLHLHCCWRWVDWCMVISRSSQRRRTILWRCRLLRHFRCLRASRLDHSYHLLYSNASYSGGIC
jgi:hypothetical protein